MVTGISRLETDTRGRTKEVKPSKRHCNCYRRARGDTTAAVGPLLTSAFRSFPYGESRRMRETAKTLLRYEDLHGERVVPSDLGTPRVTITYTALRSMTSSYHPNDDDANNSETWVVYQLHPQVIVRRLKTIPSCVLAIVYVPFVA